MLKMFIESLKNLFSEPATLPGIGTEAPKGYRGLIVFNKEKCIFCTKCELVCPVDAIKFIYPEDGSRNLEFNYNPFLCIYCGECVRACPKDGALIQTNIVPEPGTQEDNPNEKWFEIERRAQESKKKWQIALAKKRQEALKKAKKQPPSDKKGSKK
ncbi:MAG TPA: 4Fe-4S dicluster domain-containing protein [Desulfurobacteriaceae bacterium]|nr:4Fe-4S dicluster domain-containing protein [Desulfurobacteriaceae bacterium]